MNVLTRNWETHGFATTGLGIGLVYLAVLTLAACGSNEDNASVAPSTASTSASPSSTTAPASMLVGEWQRLQKCSELESVMNEAGLHDALLQSVAGDGWIPGVTKVSQIKDPAQPCVGSVDRKHSHFFTADGEFGSHDANGQQVDDGKYEFVGHVNGGRSVVHPGSRS